MGRRIRLGVIFVSYTAGLLGCSGASDVGDQGSASPIAWTKALNQPFSRSGGDITLTVRAGSEVFLSGQDSFGPTLPILKYKWDPANDAATPIKLLTRNTSTISFRAPETNGEQPLELRFQLTVEDSDGATDDASVTVFVEGIPDARGFLQYGGQPTITLAAVTSSVRELSSAVPFEIVVVRSISYRDLAGTRRDLVLDTTELPGTWVPEVGTQVAGAECGGALAPRFKRPLPALNADDVLAQFSPLSDQSEDLRTQLVDPSRIDEAEVSLHITITVNPDGSGANLPEGVSASVCVLDASGAPVASDPDSPDDYSRNALLGTPDGSRDTLDSAKAYYTSIGADSKMTFADWLEANEFTDGSTDLGQIEQGSAVDGAHAVYLNNFDLGFGRDMYMRIVGCDPGVPVPTLGGTLDTTAGGPVGKCDVAAVVINYSSLEGAAKKTGALLAVAMEYARLPGAAPADPRVTKFYVYAPDSSGVMRRVSSANLDGRGEVYVPQACVVCHGGTPQGVDSNGNYGHPQFDANGGATGFAGHGDVRAGFMSWDLTSFLFSDTDPAFSNSGDPYFPKDEQDLAASYTRTAQEANFKKLNQMAFLTMANPAGSSDAVSARFDLARDLLERWYGAGLGDGSFNDSYEVPAGWQNGDGAPGNNPTDAETIYRDVFAQNCRACHILHVPGDVTHQFAIASYSDFNDVALLNQWLGNGEMPFARMTMDRFWLARNAGRSAAQILQDHLAEDQFATPGTPAVALGQAPEALTVGGSYRLDATASVLSGPVSSESWTVTAPEGSSARLAFTDDALTPFLVGVDREGTYEVTLRDESGASASWEAPRPQTEITLQSASQASLSTLLATPLTVQWSGGDGVSRIVNVTSSNPAFTVSGYSTPTNPCVFDPLESSLGSCAVTVTAGASGSATITVWIEDIDPEQVPLTFGVVAASGLIVQPRTGYSETYRQLGGSSALLRDGESASAPLLDLRLAVDEQTDPDAVQFELVNPPAGTTLANGSNVRYSPVRGRMSRYLPNSGPARVMGPSFLVEYRACLIVDAQGGPCPNTPDTRTASIFIHTVARESTSPSWATVYGNLTTYCSGCHLEPTSDPPWMGSTPASETSVFDSTCQHPIDGDRTAEPDAGTYIVQPGDSAASALNQKPRGNMGHGGSTVPGTEPPQEDVWEAIAAWIDDGAYFTTSVRAPQRCAAAQTPP
jgi:hypothetical protein